MRHCHLPGRLLGLGGGCWATSQRWVSWGPVLGERYSEILGKLVQYMVGYFSMSSQMRCTLLNLEKSTQGRSFSHQTSTFEQCSKPLLMIGDYTSQYSEDLQLLRNSKIGSPSHGWHGLKVAGITNDFEAI